MKGFIQVKNHIFVSFVTKDSDYQEARKSMNEFILGKNPTNAIIATILLDRFIK
jgi:hypothetical protein